MRSTLKKYLPEIVYGGNDGIVTTFAVVSGFLGAEAGQSALLGSGAVVLLFGLANLFADAASMGLGNFLSERSRNEQIRLQERTLKGQIAAESDSIVLQTQTSLKRRGLNEMEMEVMLNLFRRKKDLWLDYLRSIELKLKDVSDEAPAANALATFLAFLGFGAIPLLPFLVFKPSLSVGMLSVAGTALALLMLGLLRWRALQGDPLKNILEIFLVGGTASLIAFFVGTLFRGA